MTGADTTPPPADANQLPRRTTPTWEVELLISGAAVFAMLQLPGWLDDHFFALMPRLALELSEALLVIYTYLKSATLILALTFAAHLALRAHWIAMVGLHSVYPDGVLWERLQMGPVQREMSQRRADTAEEVIERADNRATVVFAFGTMAATVLFVLGLFACVVLVATVTLNTIGHFHIKAFHAFFGVLILTLLPMILAICTDFAFGRHLPRGGRMRRALEAIFGVYWRAGVLRGFSTMNVMTSQGGQRRMMLLIAAIFMTVMAGVSVYSAMETSARPFGSYALFPNFGIDSARRVDAAHYGDRRNSAHGATVPFVQSVLVTGAYLKLVVPYQPTRDDPALQRNCPAARTAHDGGARAAVLLDCLTRLHAVSLDSKPLASLRYDAASDPRTGRPALQAMIDVRALAPGRHELRVARAPAPPGDHNKRDKATAYTIPFWH
jgi:hypothetical protein